MYRLLMFILFFFLLAPVSFAQTQKKYSKQNEALKDLSETLEKGQPDSLLAKKYENLAHEFITNKEYVKAQENFNKAKNIYIRLKNEKETARIERELAKVLELQNNIKEAINVYSSAGKLTKDKKQQALNEIDASRLQNQSDYPAQSEDISKKISLLKDADYSQDEVSDAYSQMAKVNLELNQPEEAISNYKIALENAEKPETEIKITREMADVYASNQQVNKAVELNEQLMEKAKEAKNSQLEIEQLQNLSLAYFRNSDEEKGMNALRKAYELALEKGQTIEAKQSLELLVDYYQKHRQQKEALTVYSDFIGRLDSLIKSDSTLVDAKIFQVNEEKIAQLEKERMLKDELIRKKNAFNNGLIAVMALILVFLIFIIRAWLSIKVKNKKIALQSLLREMNPHFIFNSLNSVNQFIAQNNELEANKYLTSYSKLMRTTMENSNKDFIPLSVELTQLKEYLQLEYMRFGDKFSYSIEVAPDINPDDVPIPNMLIQPQLENAIWHGLRYKEAQGILWLKIGKEGLNLCVLVEDDGIGIQKSEQLKTARQKERKSRGLTNTYERIALLNDLYHTNIRLEIKEKEGVDTGVIVKIIIPLNISSCIR